MLGSLLIIQPLIVRGVGVVLLLVFRLLGRMIFFGVVEYSVRLVAQVNVVAMAGIAVD